MNLNITDIVKILNHRYPLLLIDEVNFVEPMVRCSAQKNFSYNEWFFPGHFPEDPIVPGSLQIETYTQVVGIMLLANNKNEKKNSDNLLLVSVDRARFYKPVRPGDTLDVQVKVDKAGMGMVTSHACGFVGGALVSECKIGYKLR
jgi:3-hydroxyacyl-[acyl-carrier-protein] dehydratase